mmetsp:Transcript_93726/g.190818  ORF Transcript_93726/g.190818 Transcript_93726/m.190818 type:complete len:545 (+) Transcript_93726:99-1733(+)
MAAWRGAPALALIAAGLMLAAVGRFAGERPLLRSAPPMLFVAPPATAVPPAATEPRQRWAAAAGWEDAQPAADSATGFATAAAMAVAAAAGLGAMRSLVRRGNRTLRRVTIGHRDYDNYIDRFDARRPYPEQRKFIPGQNGYSHFTPIYQAPANPARQAMSQIHEAAAKFLPSDFYTVPVAQLSASDVKQVGSYMVRNEAPDIMVVPAEVEKYVTPKTGLRLEKEQGDKRTPLEDSAYTRYMDKRSTLTEASQTVASKASFSLDKDFIADRSALTLLLEYLGEELTPMLKQRGQFLNPVDLVKIMKGPGGKGLVLERAFEHKNLWAEFRKYRGSWKRSEVSNHGTYFPAWERLASGNREDKCYMITGLSQISGKRAGVTPNSWRFVEYNLGGLSFVTRVPTHATSDGKNVELKTKNFYYQQEVTALKTYYNMLLGGVDMFVLGIQRSGKLTQICEFTLDKVIAKKPEVVQAAERRMGRLVALLQKVKAAVESSSDDGPWVLQWQKGELVLGKYDLVEPIAEEETSSNTESGDGMDGVKMNLMAS